MRADFGKAHQVFFGKSPLTRALTRGAFGVSTKLTMDQVRDARGGGQRAGDPLRPCSTRRWTCDGN